MMKRIWSFKAVAMFVLAAWFVAACSSDDDSSNDDTDAGTDTETETETETETVEEVCEPTAEWGNSFSAGGNVKNWSLTGLFDGDADGVVDEEEADFTLEDMFCHGKSSVVIAVSDQSCLPCTQWYGSLADTSFFEDISAQNAAMLMFYSSGLGQTAKTAEETYEYFSEHYGFDPGYYVAGPPYVFQFSYFPFMAVIDLHTGELMRKDFENGDQDFMQAADIIALVTEANEARDR